MVKIISLICDVSKFNCNPHDSVLDFTYVDFRYQDNFLDLNFDNVPSWIFKATAHVTTVCTNALAKVFSFVTLFSFDFE